MPDSAALPERRRGSGVRMVYDQLRDEILDLELLPGSPIDEVQLAERFGMSRTPIREALVRLAGEGLVETLPNRSTMVSNIDFLNLHTFFDAMTLMYRVTTRLAATYHRAEHLQQMDEALARITATGENANDGIIADLDFHRTIAVATGNDYFVQFLGAISDRIMQTIVASRERLQLVEIVAVVRREHSELRDAIAARDPLRAREAMRTHMRNSAERVALQLEVYA